MLIEFSVANYRSFFEEATLSLAASSRKSKNKELDANAVFEGSGQRLLRCAAIYGANGSGKSNLLAALRFLKNFVLNSSSGTDAAAPIPVSPFLLREGSHKEPSRFRIVFGCEEMIYEYGFAATRERIEEEWLLRRAAAGGKTTELFTRTVEGIRPKKQFVEGKDLSERTRPNALFLSVCAQFNGKISSQIIRWFRRLRIVSGLDDSNFLTATARALEDTERASLVKSIIGAFDLGFSSVAVTKEAVDSDSLLPNRSPELEGVILELKKFLEKEKLEKVERLRVETMHPIYDEKGQSQGVRTFSLTEDESEGTKKLVAFAGPLSDTLLRQYVLVIDEFDARLHPLITRQIIKLFNSKASNAKNAQLIVATHDTNLLDKDLLRRDQIWFVERDSQGESHLTSLIEYKVRNDATYEKDYILGKYGAIPFLGSVDRVFEAN